MNPFFLFTFEIRQEIVSKYVNSIAYVIIHYFIILVNHYNKQSKQNFYYLTRDSNNSNLSALLNQLDVSNIVFDNSQFTLIVSIIEFALSLLITLLGILLLLQKNNNQAQQIQFRSLGNVLIQFIQIFIRSVRILYWILCYPFLLVSIYNTLLDNSMSQYFSIFTILFVVLFTFFHDFALLNDNFNKQDFLNVAQSWPYVFSSWIKLVQCSYSSYYYVNQNSHMVYLLVSFGLSFINYIQLEYFMVIFGKYDIDYIFHLVNVIYFGQSFGLLIQYFINIDDPYTLITILIIIACVAVHVGFRKWHFEYQFTNSKDVSTRVMLLNWFRELECSNIYYMGMITKHYNHPNNRKCFLRHSAIYYSGKKFAKYTYITTKKHNIEKYKGLFVKFLIKCLLETQLKVQPNSDEIRLLYSEILFYKFNLINQSFKHLSKIKNNINFNQKMRIKQLKLSIHNKLKENNQLSYRSKLPFENVLKCEEQMKEFFQAFQKIAELQVYFWKNQLQQVISIPELLKICQSILQEIQICQKQWKNIHVTNPIDEQQMLIRFRWKFFYLYFKLYILHKKLKVQEIKELPDQNLKSQQIFQDEKVDERSSSEDEAQTKSYYLTNCIISSNNLFFRVDKFGEIIAASQSTLKILGRSQNEYRGIRVETLMPDVIKENHNDFLKQFYKTGQSENLFKRRSILVKHSKGHCFKAQKYLKYIFNLEQDRFEYLSMLRQVSSRSQYIVLNSRWEIDSSSEYLYQIFGDYKLPFLSLCPKAISYTEYAQFLTNFDMKILSLKICSYGSRERIQDKKFTFRRQNDQTFSNKSINELTSLVFKRELEEKQKQNVIQLFQQILEEDNDIEKTAKLTRLNHIKLNIRVPMYKAEFQEDYNRYDAQMQTIFYDGESRKRLIIRNDNGNLRVDKFEFLQRYRWVKQQRMKFIYQKIKNLFEHFCSEKVLEKVLKVDANIKFYKTLNKTSFHILKINRLELYDENTNSNDKQENEFINTNSFRPYTSALAKEVIIASQSQSYNLKSQSGNMYSDMELITNREYSQKPFLIDYTLREDFLVQGSNAIYSLNEQKNPFIKEEINKLSKKNQKLTLLVVLNRFSFFLQLVFISFTYFFCSFYYNPITLHNSVILFGHLYKIQLLTVSSYNYIIDVALMNEQKLSSLLITNPATKFNTTRQFYDFVSLEIGDYNTYVSYIYANQDFVSMVYSGFYGDDENVSGLDILDQFKVNLLQFNRSDKSSIIQNNTILSHFRDYMVPYGQELMQDSVASRINDAIQYQSSSIDNLILFMILQLTLMLINSIFSLLIKFKFRNDINTIYQIVTNLPKDDKIKAMRQYQILFAQLNSLFEEECNFTSIISFRIWIQKIIFAYFEWGYSYVNIIISHRQQDFEINEVEKINQKRDKAKIQKPPKYSFNTVFALMCYLTIITVLFILVYYFILDNQTQVKQFFLDNNFLVQTNYFWLITLLKEKFIYENYLNSSYYPNITNFRFQQFLNDVSLFQPNLYQTSINEIQRVFDETLCDQSFDETGTYIYYNQFCDVILDGALKRGLKQFNILLSQVVIKALNPDDQRYESFTLEDLAQYQISFQIIYEIYQNNFQIWASDAENILKSSSDLSLICYITQLVVIFILYFCLLEYFLFTKLQQDFNFSKKYYRYFMLNETMNQVKTMRVDLVRSGLLSK
ncbi:unnamed protein product (macronuclear) [Paramecium tetraurelia]|uniref:PAS domain-containing protein n=1 Tax=Paramecium tetraurelia TaxID=5888 RepID=A0BXM6_PARTE|nr:uncharacterized protein GSPATT00033146001 [Paramecium tetraurelia]CAK63293.1 unnamed protein product [Paramecium tetraurelia]|eukprot:XP_001430691.1 hypothetical protein (macronuclear) [Paramecium tetraurelia strain d4-2]